MRWQDALRQGLLVIVLPLSTRITVVLDSSIQGSEAPSNQRANAYMRARYDVV